jgi:thioesterase domain-containing protein
MFQGQQVGKPMFVLPDISRKLGLTSAQQERLKAVDAKYTPAIQKVVTGHQPKIAKLSRELNAENATFAKELTPLLKQRASAVTEILTPQQKKLLIDLERAGQKSKKPAPSTKPKK